jgi:D-beta-D-heptose 7-phosphate kinase/D-beta-D-heptose 1-phosphate adenosyltransferase
MVFGVVQRVEVVQVLLDFRAFHDFVAHADEDLLHLGHLELMRHARAQGDCLVVAINSDRSVHELKGPGRPVNTQDVRARMLAGLADVDYVVIFDEVSVLPLIKELAVELRESFMLVKGGDYDRDGVVGHEVVEASGGQVKLAPLVKGLSTTELIRRISRNNER